MIEGSRARSLTQLTGLASFRRACIANLAPMPAHLRTLNARG
ncbi:hypothetical protein FHS28_001432 [Roseateles terrae]|uniref:Uncharacterized protein n=1 Tax=Roseateles terrae TaxID=431060 RepID=A0ABR6GPM7_9BURK|nr:hypothetical protein [Roseateles terrae]